MPVNRTTKLLIYAAGTALLVASLLFVGATVMRHWPAIRGLHLVSSGWLAASAGLYALSHFSTGLAWLLALRGLGQPIGVGLGLRIGLVAQIGKYLPGNVAHYLGRGALAKASGITVKSSGLSTGVELISALAAAAAVASLALWADPRPMAFTPEVQSGAIVIATGVVFAGLGFAIWLVRRGHGALLFIGPTACLACSLVLSSLSLAALLAALGHSSSSLAAVIGAVSLAWTLGFLVPGAPAGVGIREAVLIAFLASSVGPAVAAAAAILHRLITAAVDAVAAVGGYAWLSSTTFSKK